MGVDVKVKALGVIYIAVLLELRCLSKLLIGFSLLSYLEMLSGRMWKMLPEE